VKANVPVVVGPGCLDMVNFGEQASIPAKFSGRKFYIHNPQVTLMRTTAAECAELGRIVAEKANAYTAGAVIMLPTKAISVISAEGKPFHDAVADQALFSALKQHARVPVREFAEEINSPAFAQACAQQLIALMQAKK
jgi:uncharacterized protein (UPF0261 family)